MKPCEICGQPIGPNRNRTCGATCRAELDRKVAAEKIQDAWRRTVHLQLDTLLWKLREPKGAKEAATAPERS